VLGALFPVEACVLVGNGKKNETKRKKEAE